MLGLNTSKALAVDKNWETIKSSLIKILNKEKIWWGKFGVVSSANVIVWNKKRVFAIKDFIGLDRKEEMDLALSIFQKLKEIRIPTWTTYRKIEWKRSIIMTLWNKDWSLIFSANNGSKDSEQTKLSPISEITNLDDFFSSCLDILGVLTKNWVETFFDSYIYKYNSNQLGMIVWDFDKMFLYESGNLELLRYNIYQLCYCFLRASEYFVLWEDFFRKFAHFLLDEQKKGNHTLKDIDLDSLFNEVYNKYKTEVRTY